jgi:ABC-type branched-subunit amino acid transport system substrate-binding protein
MSKIFLVNVGANTSHASKARSPIFEDGTFVYVSFPLDEDNGN